MRKPMRDPKAVAHDLAADYRKVFGEDCVSIILYGSAAGPDYRPGKSDINLMVVLSEAGIEDLERARGVVSRWRKRGVAVPLLLTEAYLAGSLDVFPIEYLNFQKRHALIYGKDVLQDLAFDLEHLRLQCEREIKGKLLLLRKAYLESEGKGARLREVVRHSLRAFVAIFEALLYLKGKTPPDGNRPMIHAVCDLFGLEHRLFDSLLDVREDRTKPGEEEMNRLVVGYIAEIRTLAGCIDALGGDNEQHP